MRESYVCVCVYVFVCCFMAANDLAREHKGAGSCSKSHCHLRGMPRTAFRELKLALSPEQPVGTFIHPGGGGGALCMVSDGLPGITD